jgi:phospholipid/cholesterol/gamma-HCH transport system substrate-binding protein
MVGIATVLFVLLILLLTGKPRFFAKEIALHAFMPNAAGLGEGDVVRINGISSGRVTRISLSGQPDPGRAIKVDFMITKKLQKQVPKDSVATVGSDSLMGGVFLQVNKGTSQTTVQPDDELTAPATPQLNQLVSQGYSLLNASQKILNSASDIVGQVEDGKGTAGKFLTDQAFRMSAQSMANQVQKLGNTLETRMATIQQIAKNAEGVGTRLDGLSAGVQKGEGSSGMLLKDSKLRSDANDGLAQWKELYTRVNTGGGTVGQLMPEGKVGKQLSATLGNAATTVDKVQAGQGSVGQFLVNPSLHNSIEGTTREFHDLMKEFHRNPKKFFRVRLEIF